MQPFRLVIRAGKDNLHPPVELFWKRAGGKQAPYVDIFGADGEETAFLKGMGEYVKAGKAPVCDEDRKAAIKIAVDELAEGGKFVFKPARLDDDIKVSFGKQVIERNCEEGVESPV